MMNCHSVGEEEWDRHRNEPLPSINTECSHCQNKCLSENPVLSSWYSCETVAGCQSQHVIKWETISEIHIQCYADSGAKKGTHCRIDEQLINYDNMPLTCIK